MLSEDYLALPPSRVAEIEAMLGGRIAYRAALMPHSILRRKSKKPGKTNIGRTPMMTFLWIAILCFIVWYSFLVGHVLNNIRGLFGQ